MDRKKSFIVEKDFPGAVPSEYVFAEYEFGDLKIHQKATYHGDYEYSYEPYGHDRWWYGSGFGHRSYTNYDGSVFHIRYKTQKCYRVNLSSEELFEIVSSSAIGGVEIERLDCSVGEIKLTFSRSPYYKRKFSTTRIEEIELDGYKEQDGR